MEKIITVGLDLAKSIFQVHGIAENGKVLVRRTLRRSQVLPFFRGLPSCLVGMEACASAHHWAREITALGHSVRMMPPAYVKPYVKRNKTDVADAEAICKAVARPTMRFVPVKTAEQQAADMILRTREMLMRQRSQTANGCALIWPNWALSRGMPGRQSTYQPRRRRLRNSGQLRRREHYHRAVGEFRM